MTRLPLATALVLAAGLVACAETPAETPEAPAAEAAPQEEVVMGEAMITIPESELAMLEEEVAFLRKETTRMQEELAESKTPDSGLISRQVTARSDLARAQTELARLKAELEDTKVRLAESEARGDKLEHDLQETREVLVETTTRLSKTERDLDSTRDDLEGALRVAADAGWSDLVAKSQVALCEKGGRKKMASCRAEAMAAVAPLEPAARACLRAGHATPQLIGAGRGEDMPRQSVWIGETDRDWFVVLCDPNLPEAKALLADLDDDRRPSSSSRGLDAIEDDFMDEPATKPVAKGTREPAPVRTVSREAPVRSEPVERTPARSEPAESYEPPDLLAETDGDVDLTSLGLIDLDAGDDDDKKSRADKKREKEEAEALEEARRRGSLDGAGDDLFDEI